MERLIDLFCHAIRISDPLSIKIAVGIIGGGLPLIFIIAALTKLGEFWERQREVIVPLVRQAVPNTPDRGKESAGRRSRSVQKAQKSNFSWQLGSLVHRTTCLAPRSISTLANDTRKISTTRAVGV